MNINLMDMMWLLISTGSVLFMQAGFCFLEAGSVRSKNSINVAIKNIADFCLASAVFWAVGFAIMFNNTSGFLNPDYLFLSSVDSPGLLAFFMFQIVFCGTTTTILSGAIAERATFHGYLITAFFVSIIIYPLFGQWAWNGAIEGEALGWLNKQGFVDFAGSSVVHSVGGWVALAMVIVIGPRIGRFDPSMPPIQGHNIPMATLGTIILWFGWFGFNGGSALKFDASIPKIILNTNLAAVFGGLSALAITWVMNRKPDVPHTLNGALAGLVGITASCHAVLPYEAAFIGMSSGCIYFLAAKLLVALKIDDVVGAIPVHAFCGVWGTLNVALFGDPEILGTGLSFKDQLWIQTKGIGMCFLWSFVPTFILLTAFKKWIKLRVCPDSEVRGLNITEHNASTEVTDFIYAMDHHKKNGDFKQRVYEEPHTEVGQIAKEYNRVLHKVNFEMERSERLLLNILPEQIAERLKQGESTIADKIDDVTILFADLVGFTKFSASRNPQEVVQVINEIFSQFDILAETHGLEKIKTIGDSYMVASGLNGNGKKGAVFITEFALQMLHILEEINEKYGSDHQLRIGMHTGTVVAGVVGKKKFIYDIWGDAVNTASRMESHSIPGRIHISSETKDYIDDYFITEERGSIDIRGKGTMVTSFIVKPREVPIRVEPRPIAKH